MIDERQEASDDAAAKAEVEDEDQEEEEEEEDAPQVDQPGLETLRSAVATHLRRRLPGRSTAKGDAVAGLSLAVANVPDGMANGLLVGINPIHGLYATMVGPIVGGLTSSTQLMVITTTAAASLTASQSLAGMPEDRRAGALFLLVILTGAFQLAFGALGFGKLTRFVSFSVITGLLTGISVLLILSQLPTVAGYAAEGGNKVTQAGDVLAHLGDVDMPTAMTAAAAIALAILLPRTRLGAFGRLLAIVLPSVVVLLAGLDSVRIVRDAGDIPGGIPLPALPSFADLSTGVVTGALSVAIVILVQGVGVSQSVQNPDGSRTSVRRDMMAQGAANVASGLLRGLPVGGSVSATALSVIGGALTRWASVFAGVWMAVLVIGVPTLVEYVVMPALGALLILAGAGSIRPRSLRAIWYTGWPSRLAALTTFLCTLFLPIQAAVGIGVVLAALLYVNESSVDVSIVEVVERDDGRLEERDPPVRLTCESITVLDVYGHLFFAGARTLEQRLPRAAGAHHPVVVLRLRGRVNLGATLVDVLANYSEQLQRAGGRLYVTGLGARSRRQVADTGKLDLSGPVQLYEATAIRGESTRAAIRDARGWLAERNERR